MFKKYLTPEVYNALQDLSTDNGVTLDDIIQSGVENPESSVGVYAGDAECYEIFSKLFHPIINEYHDQLDFFHNSNFHSDIKKNPPLVSPLIRSTRIRVARNIAEMPFPAAISNDDRLRLEEKIVNVLEGITGDLKGTYHSLASMSEEQSEELIQHHLLFKKGDKYLESAGINRDWPNGRGIFFSHDKNFIVWVNEEDHLRVISLEEGGDIIGTFNRLKEGLNAFTGKLNFAYNERMGFLSSCPSNLGTGMRASVHVQLKKFSQDENFKKVCQNLDLSIRGVHGEHSESEDGVFDISNKHRLGITESEIVKKLYLGVQHLLSKEMS